MAKHHVFVTGSTGLMGGHLIPQLLKQGHSIRALVRPGSESKLPAGCTAITGNPLDAASYAQQVAPSDTFIHLVGVSHPSPAKAEQFRSIDLKSVQEAAIAASAAMVSHFIYLSVAHPAPVMKAYIAARSQGEATSSIDWHECDVHPPLVRAGTRPPLAPDPHSDLLGARKNSFHARIRAASGPGHNRSNGVHPRFRGRKSCARNPNY